MDARRRAAFELVRGYPDDSAGGLMNADAWPSARRDPGDGAASTWCRVRSDGGRACPAGLDAVSVVDAGGLYLGRLVAGRPRVARSGNAGRGRGHGRVFEPFTADTPARRVARRFEDEDLVSAPVVDADGRLIGRITVDDVIDFVREEAEHALCARRPQRTGRHFAPVCAAPRPRASGWASTSPSPCWPRWSSASSRTTLHRVVALAVLMPVVASMGGIAGSQTLILMIRGLALGQVDRANRWRLLRRELGGGGDQRAWCGRWSGGAIRPPVVRQRLDPRAWCSARPSLINLVAASPSAPGCRCVLSGSGWTRRSAGEVVLVAFTDTFGFFVFLGLAALVLS